MRDARVMKSNWKARFSPGGEIGKAVTHDAIKDLVEGEKKKVQSHNPTGEYTVNKKQLFVMTRAKKITSKINLSSSRGENKYHARPQCRTFHRGSGQESAERWLERDPLTRSPPSTTHSASLCFASEGRRTRVMESPANLKCCNSEIAATQTHNRSVNLGRDTSPLRAPTS